MNKIWKNRRGNKGNKTIVNNVEKNKLTRKEKNNK